MNKQEACTFLGVSERSLARYAAQGKIQVTYTKGTRGNIAIYDDTDLQRLKEELGQPTGVRLATAPPPIENSATTDKLATRPLANMAGFFEHLQARDETLITSLLQSRSQVAIENKLTLNLQEAAHLSGLSRNRLRDAIKEKKLKAKIIGRGWRMKRTDLEAYIQKL
jgi:excisionase family DNA binding protein